MRGKAAVKTAHTSIAAASAAFFALAAALAMPGAARSQEPQDWSWGAASTQGWPGCNQACVLDTINAAKTVVMFHSTGELRNDEAHALVEAIRRGARVEIYVGKANNLSEEVIWLADEIYQKWAATADDSDTRMIGMGGCVMGRSSHPAFVITDPFGWSAGDAPALVVDGKKSGSRDVAEAASVVVDSEEFIQCKLAK